MHGTSDESLTFCRLRCGPSDSCPFDLTFNERGSLLITNLCCVGSVPDRNPDNWTVFEAWVSDTAQPLYRLSIPGDKASYGFEEAGPPRIALSWQ